MVERFNKGLKDFIRILEGILIIIIFNIGFSMMIGLFGFKSDIFFLTILIVKLIFNGTVLAVVLKEYIILKKKSDLS